MHLCDPARNTTIAPGTSVSASTVLRTMNFIAVPKTGTTSLESTVAATSLVKCSVLHCCDWWEKEPHRTACCKRGSPWHLAPDVFRSIFARQKVSMWSGTRKRFCVVRNPAERYASDEAWFRMTKPYSTRPLPGQLNSALAHGRFRVAWDEELVHKQPQHWFVWDAEGRVQCECVVAFEKLGQLTRAHHLPSAHGDRGADLPPELVELYKLDRLLWQRALESSRLCFSPRPLRLALGDGGGDGSADGSGGGTTGNGVHMRHGAYADPDGHRGHGAPNYTSTQRHESSNTVTNKAQRSKLIKETMAPPAQRKRTQSQSRAQREAAPSALARRLPHIPVTGRAGRLGL